MAIRTRLKSLLLWSLLLLVASLLAGLGWLYWRNHALEPGSVELVATWTAQTCGTSRPGLVVDSVLSTASPIQAGEELEVAGEIPPAIRGRQVQLKVQCYRYPRAWDPKGCYRTRVRLLDTP